MTFRNAIRSAFTISTFLAPSFGSIFNNTDVLIQHLDPERCKDIAWSSTQFGESYGSPFCAHQLRYGAVIDWLRLWVNRNNTQIWEMDVHFTNNALMSVGDKNNTNRQEAMMHLNPWDAGIVLLSSNQHPSGQRGNLKGFKLVLPPSKNVETNSTTEYIAGSYTAAGATNQSFPDFPRAVLVGIDGMTGANGVEMLNFHLTTLVSTEEIPIPEGALKVKDEGFV